MLGTIRFHMGQEKLFSAVTKKLTGPYSKPHPNNLCRTQSEHSTLHIQPLRYELAIQSNSRQDSKSSHQTTVTIAAVDSLRSLIPNIRRYKKTAPYHVVLLKRWKSCLYLFGEYKGGKDSELGLIPKISFLRKLNAKFDVWNQQFRNEWIESLTNSMYGSKRGGTGSE